MPENGFVFPAFSDRSSDIHSLMYYTKNPKEPKQELMESALGCKAKRTASEEKSTFDSILKSAVNDSDFDDDEVVIEIHQALNRIIEEHDTSTSSQPVILDSRTIESLMTSGSVPEELAIKIEQACAEEFGDEPPIVENIVDTKAIENHFKNKKEQELQKEVLELKTKLEEVAVPSELPWDTEEGKSAIVLNVSPDKAEEIKAQIIDGKRYIIIPVDDEQTVINGVNTEL